MQVSKEAIFQSRVQWGPVPSWGKASDEKGSQRMGKPNRSSEGENKGEAGCVLACSQLLQSVLINVH
jgi:hypothetical protein